MLVIFLAWQHSAKYFLAKSSSLSPFVLSTWKSAVKSSAPKAAAMNLSYPTASMSLQSTSAAVDSI